MKLLLIEPQDMLRNAIGMAASELIDHGEITAHPSVTAVPATAMSGAFDVALIELSDPRAGFAGRIGRLAALKELRNRIGKSVRIIVLTEHFDPDEGAALLEQGVEKYIAKAGRSILSLQGAIRDTGQAVLPPMVEGSKSATFPAGLKGTEMLGHLIAEGILDIRDVCAAHDLQRDTVKKYITRSQRRIARSG